MMKPRKERQGREKERERERERLFIESCVVGRGMHRNGRKFRSYEILTIENGSDELLQTKIRLKTRPVFQLSELSNVIDLRLSNLAILVATRSIHWSSSWIYFLLNRRRFTSDLARCVQFQQTSEVCLRTMIDLWTNPLFTRFYTFVPSC